jgi:hypothetical protein
MSDEYKHKRTVLEGTLDLMKVPLMNPIGCDKNCEQPYTPFLCGIAATETGASNIANVERQLVLLNGKRVRVTVEWDE